MIFKHSLMADSASQNVFFSFHQHVRYLKRGDEKMLFVNGVTYD